MTLIISSTVARRKANVLMLDQVSNLLLASEPDLVRREDGILVWRVPIDLTMGSRGRLGRVGMLDINAYTGEIYSSHELFEQINETAQRLYNEHFEA
jgi:hypothetical protein